MPKPQQPELRRSEHVPALSPDASEAVLSAQPTPQRSAPDGPIPADQRPGHHPDHEQDKPDLDAMAARLGVVPDGDEPEGHASVSTESDRDPAPRSGFRRSKLRLAMVVASPVVAYVVARAAVRAFRSPRLPLR